MKTRKIYQGFAYSSLDRLLETVNRIIADNPEARLTYKDFSFDYETDYDSDRIMVLEWQLPETEKERLAREKTEADLQRSREEYERKQFEALKKKYGTNE